MRPLITSGINVNFINRNHSLLPHPSNGKSEFQTSKNTRNPMPPTLGLNESTGRLTTTAKAKAWSKVKIKDHNPYPFAIYRACNLGGKKEETLQKDGIPSDFLVSSIVYLPQQPTSLQEELLVQKKNV